MSSDAHLHAGSAADVCPSLVVRSLINDSLINNIWTFGSLACGLFCGIFAYAYLQLTNPQYLIDNASE